MKPAILKPVKKPIKSREKRSQPIANDVVGAMQKRKDEKGTPIHRSLDDAIRFALKPENVAAWW